MAEASPVQYIIRLHSSSTAIGFNVLKVENGEEQLVNGGHRILTQAQSNWSTLKRELVALKWAYDSNPTLLAENDYVIETDFLPLRSLLYASFSAPQQPPQQPPQ